jgi:hypothetical protein
MRMTLRASLCMAMFAAVGSTTCFGQAPQRQVQVVIVAVPHFEIQSYNSDGLVAALQDRCTEIQNYFTRLFGKDNVKLHPFCTEEDTKREKLRHLFSVELPEFSANTLTFVFIMSHGEPVAFKNGLVDSDVEIIASDSVTSDEDFDSKKERQFSSILLGSELLTWMELAPPGSTILTFVDTCHSGAVAANLSTALSEFLAQKKFGLRSLVMTSSLAQQDSYDALFTKELLEMWGQKGCINQSTFGSDMYQRLKINAPLKEGEWVPAIPIQYEGPLCLGNFGEDRKLLFIYAGQSAEQDPFRYDISEVSGTSTRKIVDDGLLESVYLPVPLDAKQYELTLRRGSIHMKPFTVDLIANASQLVWLDEHSKAQTVAKGSEIMAKTAEFNGSPESEVARLLQQTSAAYRSLGQTEDARRIDKEITARGDLPDIDAIVHELAFLSSKFVAKAVSSSPKHEPSTKLAYQFQQLGDFNNAGALYAHAASDAPDPPTKNKFATEAYFSYLGAGNASAAQNALHTYAVSLPIGTPKFDFSIGPGEQTGPIADRIRAVGLLHSLGAVIPRPEVSKAPEVVPNSN